MGSVPFCMQLFAVFFILESEIFDVVQQLRQHFAGETVGQPQCLILFFDGGRNIGKSQ